MQSSQTELTTRTLSALLSDIEAGTRPRGGVRGISSGIPSLGGEHLNSLGGFDFSSIKYVPENFALSMNRGKVRLNDILVVKDGATTGKVSFVNSDFPYKEAVINEHIFLLRTKPDILPKYLFWFLWSSLGQSEIISNFQGSAQGGINRTFVDGVEVPVCDIDEQRKIVVKVDELFPQVSQTSVNIQKAKLLIQKFRQSVLSAAVTGKLTEGWREKHLNENGKLELEKLFGTINTGNLEDIPDTWGQISSSRVFSYVTSGSRGWARYYSDKGNLFFRVGNLEHNSISLKLDDVKYVKLPDKTEGRRTKLQPNDLLISITADIGRIALISSDIDEGYINQHIALARPVTSIYAPFLAWYLATYQGGWSQFVDKQRGATKVGLGLDDISSITIPFPPIAEQKEIVSQIDRYLGIAHQVELQIENTERKVNKLTQSILAKAFRGELVN
ncbi:MAG: restriction endonuclease subunit S [Candidatus Daviesbacteria bacterium]|nr:restriction endonuclease subunit S [Candidatus Daviesbacteria bacterium]